MKRLSGRFEDLDGTAMVWPNTSGVQKRNKLSFYGPGTIRIFKKGVVPAELGPADDLSFLIK